MKRIGFNPVRILDNVQAWLLRETGEFDANWSGKLSASVQRELFGHVFGRGTIWINFDLMEIQHSIKVDFGTDWIETGGVDFKFPMRVWDDRAHGIGGTHNDKV